MQVKLFQNCSLRSTFGRSDDNSTQGSDVVYVIECLLPVAASTHMQSFVRFGWPAVDPLCVSLLTANADAHEDRDDCCECCVSYTYFFIMTHIILDNVLDVLMTILRKAVTCCRRKFK